MLMMRISVVMWVVKMLEEESRRAVCKAHESVPWRGRSEGSRRTGDDD